MIEPVDPAAERAPGLRGPLLAAVALVVVAAGFAVWSFVAWSSAGDDVAAAEQRRTDARARLEALRTGGDLDFARTRDELSDTARTAIVTMNTLDYRKLDEGLADWADATTGELHDQIVGLTGDKRRQLADQQPVTSATVKSLAVKELDARAGTATVLAATRKSVATGGGEPKTTFERFQATLTDTDDGWKLDSLSQVAYQEPGS